MRQVSRRARWGAVLAAVVTTAVAASALPTVAATTPPTVPNGRGGVITLDDDHFHPGDTISLSGVGFSADPVSASQPGRPVLAVKLDGDRYEGGDFPWTATGTDVVDPASLPMAGGGDGYAAIAIRSDGTFSADITIPADWTPGHHFLQFLGGSLSTTSPGKTLPVQSFVTSFPVLAPNAGAAKVLSVAHAQNSTTNGKVVVDLRNFRTTANGGGGQKVGVKIDGTGEIIHCITTDADGDASGVSVPLPGKDVVDLAAGEHTLNFLAGTACVSGSAQVEPPGKHVQATFKIATFDVTSATHVAGGPITVDLRGFTTANGAAGQKVAMKVTGTEPSYNGPVSACVVTDTFGHGTATFDLPTTIPTGRFTLNALAGSNCGDSSLPPADPARSLQASFVVSDPTLDVVTTGRITGRAQVGSTLAATVPTWTATPTSTSVQWLRDGATIRGATSTRYRAVAADAGKRLTVRFTATLGPVTAESFSTATAKVALGTFRATKAPTVKGTAKVGRKLTATKGTWSSGGVTVTYQWLRNGKVIRKATRATYTVTKADRRKKISVRVVAKKPGYASARATSTAKKVR